MIETLHSLENLAGMLRLMERMLGRMQRNGILREQQQRHTQCAWQ